MRFPSIRLLFATSVLLAACGGGGDASTNPAAMSIRVVAGADVADTIDARPLQPLVVEVREDGQPKPGLVVRFTTLPPTDTTRRGEDAVTVSNVDQNAFGLFASDTTDPSGRASALVQLGTVSGQARVVVTCQTFGIADTAQLTVLPGNTALLMLGVRDTVVRVSGTFRIAAYSTDRYRNARPQDTVSYQAKDPLGTVSAAGTVRAGLAVGRGTVVARVKGIEDSTHYSVVPVAKITAVYVGADAMTRLATLDLDGSNLKVIGPADPLANPSHSPTQDLIAYNSSEGIALVTGSGSRRVLVDQAVASSAYYPVFSPDGTSIYFVGTATAAQYSGFGIWRIGIDGSGLTKVASSNYFFTTPAVSPEGTRLAFFHNAGLYIHSLATGDSLLIGPRGWFPDFSPDGQSVVYHSDDGSVRIVGSSSLDIGVYPIPGARVSWLPDGRWLLTRMADGPVLLNSINFKVVPLPSLWRVRDMTVNR